MKSKQILLNILVATAVSTSSILIYNKYFNKKETIYLSNPSGSTPVSLTNFSAPLAIPGDFVEAAEKTVNTVVNIKSIYENSTNQLYYDPFRFFFGDSPYHRPQQQMATGSGVILTEDGYIVTNNHVIKGADKIEVTLNNKETYEAKVVGMDPATDLALIKIDADNLPFAKYGNSDDVKVGEWVLAVGNPFNLTSTVTAGIVSAKARNINIIGGDPRTGQIPIESFIQTDAAVNPGNSGGALVNTRGELIGINTAIASNTGSYTGYSFAIPVNIVQKVVTDLAEFGEVQRALLGISIRDIDSKLAKEKNLKELSGVYVAGTIENGSAEDAGIKEGDIITKINNIAVNSIPQLQEQVGRYRPGDKIAVEIIRNGNVKIIPVILKNKKGNTDVVKRSDVVKESISSLGATFEALDNEEKERLRLLGGAKITALGPGKLRSAGIKEGFIITKIDKKEIKSPEDIESALYNKKGGVLIEGVYPNGMRAYYGFGM
ncbi:MAG: Do family serine endopeptidase [Bacteroidia bacterium]